MSAPPSSPPSSVLVVDDEISLGETLLDLLEGEGMRGVHVVSLDGARREMARREFGLMLLDLQLPDGSGLDLLAEVAAPPLGPGVLVLTGHASVDAAVSALRTGALDFLTKPFDLQTLLHRVRIARDRVRALSGEMLRRRQESLEESASPWLEPISPAMREAQENVARFAAVDVLPVLVTGETGTGKEHLCHLLHRLSARSSEPWVAVNCATLDRQLIQSELFGHERGAFTGAAERRKGLFELADRGTLFLDEIGELPLEAQAAFLRVLETGRFRRLGGSTELSTRVRVVAATNVDLVEAAARGTFREDLLYRLDAARIRVPPLRDRPEDIERLAIHFSRRMAASLHREVFLGEAALSALVRYPWPGNVRELRNVVERSVVLRDQGEILPEDLGLEPSTGASASTSPDRPQGVTLEEVEKGHVLGVLEECGGNRSEAARVLGIARSTLLRKLERWC